MSESIGDLLAKRDIDEPRELAAIRGEIKRLYDVTPKLKLNGDLIIIGVAGSGLAGALRPQLRKLQKVAKTDKKIVIKIVG